MSSYQKVQYNHLLYKCNNAHLTVIFKTTMKSYVIIPVIALPLLLTPGCSWLIGDQDTAKDTARKKAAGSCLAGNCQDGQGVWRYDDGRQYVGSFVAGRPGGYGVLTLSSGSEYSGTFNYGQYDGGGDVIFANGTPAVCERGNCINGRGILHFEDDSIYSGEFNNEIRSGFGGMMFDDGTTYSGEFKNNLYHGEGTLTLPDTTEYRGIFKNGLKHGEFIISFPSKRQFIGEFANDSVAQGKGVVIFPNNSRGKCVSGNCITRKGILELDDGSSYEGDFVNCSRHGTGMFTLASGSRYEGNFKNGKRDGQGTFIFASGLIYEGSYKDGKRHGPGVFIFPNNRRIEVLFNEGKME